MTLSDFVEQGEQLVGRIVEQAVQESLHLEMKAGRIFGHSGLDRSAREALASVLSSFANSDGGLLLIGVDCRKIERVDAAVKLSPINGLGQALTAITDLIGEGLQPKHDGIVAHAIPSSTVPDAGYLVVSVPRSSRRPHMNSFTKSYFKRAGASKFAMEHYDVEDAFRRLSSPDLAIEHDLVVTDWPSQHGGTVWKCRLKLALRNTGNSTAKHIVFRYPARMTGVSNFRTYEPENPGNATTFRDWQSWSLGPEFVVHPGDAISAHRLYFDAVLEDHGARSKAFGGEDDLAIRFQLLAEEMPIKEQLLTVSGSELTALLRARAAR